MSFKWDRVHVWSAEIQDQPGAAASKLAALAQAGANLEFIDTQRLPGKAGFGTLTVAPITGAAQQKAARAVGLHEAETPILHRFKAITRPAWPIASLKPGKPPISASTA
ncbi:MAG: hypothetical protein U0744_21565 [Gemmataceae bacterium]